MLLQLSFDFHLHGVFFHPLTFSLNVSLGLKWVSRRQHIYGSCFCIHSASLCILVGAFNPFTFKVIIDMYVPMTIFLIVMGFVFFFLTLFYLFYLFMAVLGLRFCARAFSSCGKWGPPLIAVRGASHYRGLSRCGAQAPDAQAQQLWLTGPAAPRHAGSSQTRARTRVPCTGRQILNHCATREALWVCFCRSFSSFVFPT